jgi:hypothetical protein
MAKKYVTTRELANIYPRWSKVRTDELSVGYRMLNSIAAPMEYMQKSLEKMEKNTFLTTANLDEIDITYRFLLPKTFEFEFDSTDPTNVVPITPVTSGLHLDEWHSIALAEHNDIESFWYDPIPDRASITDAISGVNDLLLTLSSEDGTVSGLWKHHLADTDLNGGKLYIETAGGTQYLRIGDDNIVERGRVVLTGKTRKGTQEQETLIFPWDSKQATQKEWEELTKVDVFDMEDGIQIEIRSSDITTGPYLDFWNLRYSDNRKKIDTFWELGYEDISTLDLIKYTSDEWQQLVLGFSDRNTVNRWELLNTDSNVISGLNITVSGVDVAVQPFTDRAWVITEDAQLYCYDLIEDMTSGLNNLRGITSGAHVQIEIEQPEVVLGEAIEFIPWHARPLKEIRSYDLWYKKPDGTKVAIDDAIIADGTPLTRSVKNLVSIPTTQRGGYLLAVETTFVDGDVQIYKTLANVNYKIPLVQFDLSSTISGVVEGLEFDSDQRMWVKTTNDDFYKIDMHYDLMLIDYDKKIVYFREPYDEVNFGTD